MKTEEGKIKDGVKAFLKERRVASLTAPVENAVGFYHMPVPMGYGTSLLDFTICYRGTFILAETKSMGSKLTPRQEMIARMTRTAGGWAVWGASSELVCARLAQIFDTLDELG